MGKIGLGIITCNREDFYKQCLDSIPTDVVDVLVTINDGKPYEGVYDSHEYIQHEKNKGVGVTKNQAMKYLLDNDCEHVFLIEDDIIIKDKNVFKKYIDTAKASGVWHMMFGYHGPANKTPDKKPNPKLVVDYGEHKIAFNHNCVGAFCYYHKGILKNAGLMDEAYKNAWEHVAHSYDIVRLGLLPAYWWWPDVANSYEYLDELACSEENSSIRWEDNTKRIAKSDWQENISKGAEHFYKKYNQLPTSIPDTPIDTIQERLKVIKKNYARL